VLDCVKPRHYILLKTLATEPWKLGISKLCNVEFWKLGISQQNLHLLNRSKLWSYIKQIHTEFE
jgi:hypothetical protein